MLLIYSISDPRFASDGEIEQIFDNIHPNLADLAKLDEYCRLKLFGRSRRRFQIDTKHDAPLVFRKRVFMELVSILHTPFSLHMSELVEVIPADHSRLHALFPAFPQ